MNKPLHEYLVTWEIEVGATSPEEAARKALAVQRNPDSIATFFTVLDKTSNQLCTVDLPVLEE